ncbi:hypothetical protein [Paractinoplanes durhamensis]|uniref:Uncharacterized protein n=1 Tax=Paractinoplanes durhamensis TaxID=113563 RepID=A0ABQ3YVE8_9ACTN|nr:hypothetical protein [Actinoplanes durhamensis]GIE01575.1 hypothetical protein Adu01nite_29250 [Actinoplanes durhamensis]
MTDELEKLFKDLRTTTLSEIVPPGTPQIRATVRRRRGTTALVGTGAAVATVLLGAGVALYPGSGTEYDVGDPTLPSVSASDVPVMPEPSGPAFDRMQAAGELLADRDKTPTSINATAAVVAASYENRMNDMPADTYTFHFYCVGEGSVDVVVKQGDRGNTVLGQGTATCAEHDATPLTLTIRQPKWDSLRISAAGDARSAGQAGFAFEFLSATGRTTFGPSGPPSSVLPTVAISSGR